MTTPSLFDSQDPMSPMEAAFWRFHHENPTVYSMLCRFALEAVNAGRTRLSTKLLFERIRWYTTVETRGEDFKLNNNYTAFYARLWMRDNPAHPAFFALRRQKIEASI